MKPHPKLRKTIKWGGAAVTVLLVVLWSKCIGRYLDFVDSSGRCVGIGYGTAFFASGMWTTTKPLTAVAQQQLMEQREFVLFCHQVRLLPRWYRRDGKLRLFVPLWLPALAMGLSTAWAWRRDTLADHRARLSSCSTCTYDRTGLAKDAVCPECGSAAP